MGTSLVEAQQPRTAGLSFPINLQIDPGPYLKIATNYVQERAQETIDQQYQLALPYIKQAFKGTPKEDIIASSSFLFSVIQRSIPLSLEAFKISKAALRLMFEDLFEAFVDSNMKVEDFFGQEALAIGMFGASLAAHKLALKYLKEDPEQAKSITYGAMTGILASYVMNHDVVIGTLSGAIVGLVTDTAKKCITYNSVTSFFKTYYKKLKVQENAKEVHRLASQIFPYISFTIGTALVYSRLSPLIDKIMEGEEIPSKKIHILKVIFASGMLFGMVKSYLTPLARSLGGHAFTSLQSAYRTGLIASWTPRILTIICFTRILSSKTN